MAAETAGAGSVTSTARPAAGSELSTRRSVAPPAMAGRSETAAAPLSCGVIARGAAFTGAGGSVSSVPTDAISSGSSFVEVGSTSGAARRVLPPTWRAAAPQPGSFTSPAFRTTTGAAMMAAATATGSAAASFVAASSVVPGGTGAIGGRGAAMAAESGATTSGATAAGVAEIALGCAATGSIECAANKASNVDGTPAAPRLTKPGSTDVGRAGTAVGSDGSPGITGGHA